MLMKIAAVFRPLLCGGVLLAGGFAATAAPESPLRCQEDFEGGTLTQWVEKGAARGQTPSFALARDRAGNQFLRCVAKEGILVYPGFDATGDFTLTGRMRAPQGGQAWYSGVVIGAQTNGTFDLNSGWRFYPCDGGKFRSAWGDLTATAPLTMSTGSWVYFKISKRAGQIEIYWSPDNAFAESKLVLKGSLPKVVADKVGPAVGLLGVNGVEFDDLCLRSLQERVVTPQARELTGNGFRLELARNGLPTQFTSLIPTPLALLAESAPFTLAVTDSKGQRLAFTELLKTWEDADGFRYELTAPGQAANWQATVAWQGTGDALRMTARITALKPFTGRREVRCAFGFKPMQWDYVTFIGAPMESVMQPLAGGGWAKVWNGGPTPVSRKPGEKKLYLFQNAAEFRDEDQAHSWDSDVPWPYITMPLGVAERADRLLAFGDFDIGQEKRFALDGEGAVTGTFPIFLRFPEKGKAGDSFRFTLNFKNFQRPAANFTQVADWYLNHMYSSNPATREAAQRANAKPPRAVGSGLAFGGPNGLNIPLGETRPGEREAVEAGLGMLWWISALDDVTEVYPLDDRPYYFETLWPATRALLKQEIRRQQLLGLYPNLYRRAWLIWESTFSDKIPYRRWVKNVQRGVEKLAIETQPLPPEVAKVYGFDKIHKVLADFAQDDFRDWYVKQTVGELAEYRPSGISWDMTDNGTVGIMDAMMRVRNAAYDRFPEMRFVGNEGGTTPSAIHCDAIAIEGFEVGSKSERHFQFAKAHGMPIFNLIYSVYYQTSEYPTMKNWQADIVSLRETPCFSLRYRLNQPLPPEQAVVKVRVGADWHGKGLVALTGKELIADGQWHTATADLTDQIPKQALLMNLAMGQQGYDQRLADAGQAKAVEFNLPAGNCRLECDSFRFQARGADDAAAGNILAADEFDDSFNWIGSVRPRVQDGRAFFQADPRQPQQWLKTDFRPFYRGVARGLALGGLVCNGGEPPLPQLQALADFSLQAAKLKPVKEPLAVQTVSPGDIVTSGWCGASMVLAAAYNQGKEPAKVTVEIDETWLREHYGLVASPLTLSRLELFDTRTGLQPTPKVKLASRDGKWTLTGTLAPNQLLMIRVN
jgi:hypothetical protein